VEEGLMNRLLSPLRKLTFSHWCQLIIICTLVYIAYELAYIYDKIWDVQIAVRNVSVQGPLEVYATKPLDVKVANEVDVNVVNDVTVKTAPKPLDIPLIRR
jgi:hypothetical protein